MSTVEKAAEHKEGRGTLARGGESAIGALAVEEAAGDQDGGNRGVRGACANKDEGGKGGGAS